MSVGWYFRQKGAKTFGNFGRSECWLGGRESLPQLSETPTNTSVFNTTRMMSANWRFGVLSSARVCFRLFSDSASAMTLEMTLAPNASGVRRVGNLQPQSLSPRFAVCPRGALRQSDALNGDIKVRTSTQFWTNFNTFRSPMEAPQMVPLLSTEMPSGKLAPPFGRGSGMKAVTTPSLTLPI